ncbi:MAG TPA: hypothetical protein VFB45_14535 [Pseudolabrys sp.]|nr:hypothetical protein [Pseudolabrys sp.]
MNVSPRRLPLIVLSACACALLAGCASNPFAPQPEQPPPAPAPVLPPAFGPQEIVGRWGSAAYHRPEDRERTEANAASTCKQPYVISMGPTGGVMMYLPDDQKLQELRLKGGPGGKTYIGPDGEAGGQQDREVVSFDGRVLQLKAVDPEVLGRYGIEVYVRCGAEGARPVARKPKPKPKPAAPKPG